MNELQQIEFQILKACIDVCDELNLRYYLVCGTALGAVKYGGFIPWDDDVDIGLPREDYKTFCRYAQAKLPSYYFLQTYETDPCYPMSYCKIRDSRTTYIEKNVASLKMNHGVYIDVFPLDGYPKEKKDQVVLEKRKRLLELRRFCAFEANENYSAKAKLLRRCCRLMGWHKQSQRTAKRLDALVSRWPIDNSDLICNHGNWQGKLEYAPREQYGNGVFVKFEGLDVRVPEKYDDYLTQKYGEWRKDPPKDAQQGHHYYSIMDLHSPYTEYTK